MALCNIRQRLPWRAAQAVDHAGQTSLEMPNVNLNQ
jgi:hypothetical protein